MASGGHSSSRCVGLSPSRPLFLWSTGSRCTGSVIVAQGSSCSAACGIFPDQGSNPCPLHWQADSQPLRHQGSPHSILTSTDCQNPEANLIQWKQMSPISIEIKVRAHKIMIVPLLVPLLRDYNLLSNKD